MALEVDDRGGGLATGELPAVAEVDHGVGERAALLGGVDHVDDDRHDVVGALGVVVSGCLEEVCELGSDQGWARQHEREVDVGELTEACPEFGEGLGGEVADFGCGPAGVLGEEGAVELIVGGPSSLAAAAFDFAA